MSNLLNVGRITRVFGVKGWVRIHSQTEPIDNIFNYQPWFLKTKHGVKPAEIAEWRPHGQFFIARIVGVDDRHAAELLCPVDIAVEKEALEVLEDGEFYWHQLEGLRVISEFDGQVVDLGRVKTLLPTGANDVLVVVGDEHSRDQKERLIPYVPDQFVTHIDLADGVIRVDWDPNF